MERAENAVLPCAPEDETKEEIYAKLLENPNIPIDAKKEISRMFAKWELNVEELNAENESLKKALLSYGSYFLPKELDIMILERVDAMDLKQVALVKRTWRSYIAANALKMRACIVDYIRIGIPSRKPFNILKLKQSMVEGEYEKRKREQRVSLSQLLYYQPQGFLKFDTSREISKLTYNLYVEQLTQIKSLPKWWFKLVKKVHCCLRGSFIDRFEHLSELCVYMYENSAKIERLVRFIRKAPKTDSLIIIGCYGGNHFLVDEVLEVLIEKSLVYPAEFPIFAGKCSFTIAKIIRFIEANQFKSDQTHRIHVFTPIDGTVEEWNEWLRYNSDQLHYFHLDAIVQNLSVDGINLAREKIANNRWKFVFRGEYFDVVFDSFAATPVLQ